MFRPKNKCSDSYPERTSAELFDDTTGVTIQEFRRPGIADDRLKPADHMFRIIFLGVDEKSEKSVALYYDHAKDLHGFLGRALERVEQNCR